MRLRIDLAYDGTEFRGWAIQPGLRTVQGEVERALGLALHLPEPLSVVCAGRTDAGVHARGQVLHCDVPESILDAAVGRSPYPRAESLARRLDGIVPQDISVRGVRETTDGFDARFSALWRRYAYRIADHPAAHDPLTRSHVLQWPRPLDLEAMNEASAVLVGRHDFASFCKMRPGATTIRTLLDLRWTRDEAGRAVGIVRADAFCHSMVRSLVGCLISIGEGRRPVAWAEEVLRVRQRSGDVRVVHAHGLTLEEVAYPEESQLAARADETRARRTDAEVDGD